jgi:hypothetical protein
MADNVADGPLVMREVSDTEVISDKFGEAEEVCVLGDDYPRFAAGVFQMIAVRTVEQAGVGGRGYVDPATPQTVGNGMGDMLINMKSHRRLGLR